MIIKSNIARAVFRYNPEVKKQLWGGELWTDGYYIAIVSFNATEDDVTNYVKNQGNSSYELVSKDTVYQS